MQGVTNVIKPLKAQLIKAQLLKAQLIKAQRGGDYNYQAAKR